MTEMISTLIAEKWTLLLPAHRADRGVWPDGPHEGEPLWNQWERERLESMHALLKPGDLIIDVGAEEGDLSALYASWGCRVFLAEPNPKVWPNIRAIFEANGLECEGWMDGFFGEHYIDGARTLHPVGQTVTVAQLNEDLDPNDPWPERWPASSTGPTIGDHGFLNLSENDNPERPISEMAMDELADWFDGVAAITIDVEGSELRVLRGAEGTLRRDRPMVWCSEQPEMMERMYGDTLDDLGRYMMGLGYEGRLLANVHELHYLWLHMDAHAETIAELGWME